MIRKLGTVLEMIKVQHSVFALPWAFVAAFYAAKGMPSWAAMGWILLAMVSARSAAMAFNRAVDARYDAENPRTRNRAIPAGKLGIPFTLAFALAMTALLVVSAAMLNPLCLKLSPLALLVTLGYSFTKRFTSLCHFVLGLSLAAAPIGAWLAVAPERASEPLPYLLAAGVCLWIAGADILYACEDFDFDRSKRLHSIPARLGIPLALKVSTACHVGAVLALAAAGIAGGLGPWFHAGTVLIAGLLVYEHRLVKPDDLKRLNQAFFHCNAVVSGVILAAGLADLYL